jgi:hypothetical protein
VQHVEQRAADGREDTRGETVGEEPAQVRDYTREM